MTTFCSSAPLRARPVPRARPLPITSALTQALPPALALTLALGLAQPARAQPDSAPPLPPVTSPEPPPASDATAVRQALQKKEGDADQSTLLKETLTATEKQYSLLKSGRLAVTYDLSYQYTGVQTFNVNFADSTLTLFDLQNTRAHTITNSASIDYGLLDNVTATVTLPLVSKFTQTNTFTGITNGIGDISIGVRAQPFALKRDGATTSFTGTLRLPTGRSPFTTIVGHDLATGGGFLTGTVGANLSKVIDPVALFGSVNLTLADAQNHLHQVRDNKTLLSVKPGPSIGFGGGFAYALSYDISTTVSFQETISAPSHLTFDGSKANTSQQTSGILNIGFGVRTSPKTTMNFSLGIGMTADSPNFTLGMNMPLHFGSVF